MQNALKTTFLLAALTALVLSAGYWLGGQSGMIVALGFAVVMNFGAYWFSDKFALAAYHAREVPEQENPTLHRMVADLAQRAGIPKPRVFMTDLPVPNAFATGRNPSHAVVAVTKGLLQALDGIEVDRAGNLYVSGPGGLWILDAQGRHLGTVRGPRLPANFAWGDADGRTLYWTARSALYRMRLGIAGTRP